MMVNIYLFMKIRQTKYKRVLIVGGGDGGILREVCKHNCVEEIVQCEIDEGVIEAYFIKSILSPNN